jgi:acetyl esterase/lipase
MMKRLWLWFPRWLRILFLAVFSLVVLLASAAGTGWWYWHPPVDRTDGVVYGQRDGKPLTLDVIRPKNPNGIGIALMVSGGWKSGKPGETATWLMAPLLRRGYTVFAICHISQPEATVMEIIDDVNHGVRFVRHHAEEYGIDPDRIGVTGGSAGGHLSLMLATRGGIGDERATDLVDRRSSAVQAVAIFYPVTDLLNLGESTENLGDGGPPKSFVEGFGFTPPFDAVSTNMTHWRDIGRESSPIYHVNSNLPPTLIYHGDADTLVPLDQSERYRDRAEALGQKVKLVVHRGGEHGWLTMIWDIVNFAAWFDEHLR